MTDCNDNVTDRTYFGVTTACSCQITDSCRYLLPRESWPIYGRILKASVDSLPTTCNSQIIDGCSIFWRDSRIAPQGNAISLGQILHQQRLLVGCMPCESEKIVNDSSLGPIVIWAKRSESFAVHKIQASFHEFVFSNKSSVRCILVSVFVCLFCESGVKQRLGEWCSAV